MHEVSPLDLDPYVKATGCQGVRGRQMAYTHRCTNSLDIGEKAENVQGRFEDTHSRGFLEGRRGPSVRGRGLTDSRACTAGTSRDGRSGIPPPGPLGVPDEHEGFRPAGLFISQPDSALAITEGLRPEYPWDGDAERR